jgi:hypothetical protein
MDKLMRTLRDLYAHLLKEQKPLPHEFQKVLDDNFSELLARW